MRRGRRWKAIALLASGMAIGVVMVGTPAGAHVSSWAHNWNKHIKPKADARYYTKAKANARYVNEGELLWAVVNADVTLARGHGATSVAPSGTGNYVVRFTRNVRECAYVATIGLSGASGTESPGFITVVAAAVDVNAVFVTTDDITGASAARGFHLFVNCGTAASPARIVPSGERVDGGGPENVSGN